MDEYSKKIFGTDADTTARYRFVDIHCHCLPGIDDGPATVEESISMCRMLCNDGVRIVVATPHQLGYFRKNTNTTTIRKLVEQINSLLQENHIDLTILPGADCRIDEQLPALLASDRILSIGDNHKYILIELPSQVALDILPMIEELGQKGIACIITHPERCDSICKNTAMLRKWLCAGVLLQITAASLAGDFGDNAHKMAWLFVNNGYVAAVASDAHNISTRPPRMRAAFELLGDRCGTKAAEQLCRDNPLRIIRSEPVLTPCMKNTEGEIRL